MSNIIIPIITGIVCLAVGVIIGFLYRKSVAEKEIGSAETEATRIINEAIKAGETKKRESILEAKDEIHKQRAARVSPRNQPVFCRTAALLRNSTADLRYCLGFVPSPKIRK